MSFLDCFHHQISGNPAGSKLVFLHGLMGSGANWRRIARDFESDFHILTFDQRGHGRSFHPETGYAPSDFAQDLSRILDELGWESISLVGHSMGGRNALEFAANFTLDSGVSGMSHKVSALVIEDIGPEATPDSVSSIERLLDLVPVPFPNRQAARDFFEKQYPELIHFNPQPEVVSRFFLSNIEPKSDGTMNWRFNKDAILQSLRAGRDKDRWEDWKSLKVPTLVVRGETSKDLPRPMFDQMLETLPQAEGVEIANAGHWVHFDQPEAFIAAVKAFLNAHVKASNL